ncbi:hypothetical protein BN3658_02501 [Coriobacteriaceae bacterium CHKCI002]|nr:hypothetical protein BN3658_02501 [Coriobacteriaceae bacterium CHKCI002]
MFHVKHSLFGVPVARAYGRGLWVRITLAKSAIPEKAAWFVSYGILPNGLRKTHPIGSFPILRSQRYPR